MSHNAAIKNFDEACQILDPGNAGTITVDRNPCYVPLTSAGAETRTLARPTKVGATVKIVMNVDGGDITLTVTGGLNEAGDTTFVFSDPGQFIILESIKTSSTYLWRMISNHSIANMTLADADILNGLGALTATMTELNAAADFPASQAVTATADGLTTGLIASTTKIAIITSASADNIATLPGISANSLGIGHIIRGRIAATGCEIRTLASSNETINGVDGDGTQEMALAANNAFTAIVESATGWLIQAGAATVPD
jgi:hypothetical protein